MKEQQKVEELFDKYLGNECSPEEAQLLFQYFSDDKNEEFLRSLINRQLSAPVSDQTGTGSLQRLFNTIQEQKKSKEKTIPQAPVKSLVSRFAVAASILIVLLAVSYFAFNSNSKQTLAEENETNQFQNDIPPGGNKAVLTLADGSKIVLDSAANGILTQQGNTKVLHEHGKLVYDDSRLPTSDARLMFNTISTPRGGEYQVVLPDGSKVWLNAASSLRFPTAFSGKERKVEITGEAYFEIARNASKPFKVHITLPNGAPEGTLVEVLGTHFNINAYNDEESIKTTLLEGSVKIVNGESTRIIKPRQQAQFNNLPSGGTDIQVQTDVDVQKAIAWKNGLFDWETDHITTITRQLSRWYDIDIFFEGKVPARHYTGSIRRQVNISEVIRMLELAGGVNFLVEGKKIIAKEK